MAEIRAAYHGGGFARHRAQCAAALGSARRARSALSALMGEMVAAGRRAPVRGEAR